MIRGLTLLWLRVKNLSFRTMSTKMTKHFTHLPKGIIVVLVSICLSLNCSIFSDPELAPESTSTTDTSLVLAVSDIVVGENRLSFGMFSKNGSIVKDSPVEVEFVWDSGSKDENVVKTKAYFMEIAGSTPHRHIDGEIHLHDESVGVHVVEKVEFKESGIWVAKVRTENEIELDLLPNEFYFQVMEESSTLMVGDLIPHSQNPVITPLVDFRDITTHQPPIPEFYRLTIAEALMEKKPLVVVFSTPAFCMSRMCGPVTDVVAEAFNTYNNSANFIHIEPWDLQSAREGGPLIWSEVASEWQLPSEPWVFIVDDQGKVFARFEGPVNLGEIQIALESILQLE